MHEISLLEQVREVLIEHSQEQHFSKVSKVTLEIGKLSCVEEAALRFGFDVVMKDSLAEDAQLNVTCIEGLGICQDCHQSVLMLSRHDPCGLCGGFNIKIIQGEEMRIKDLVVI